MGATYEISEDTIWCTQPSKTGYTRLQLEAELQALQYEQERREVDICEIKMLLMRLRGEI